MANDSIERIFSCWQERAATAKADDKANTKFALSDNDSLGYFDDDVEAPEEIADEAVGDWEDYDVLPKWEAIVPPACAKTRGLRVFDGVRFGRHSRRGAKTPRAKTRYREQIRG